MLLLLDVLFTVAHLAVIAFNLFGWVKRRTQRLHRWCVGVTAACWLAGGAYGAFGYCPLTDWQWRVKALRGETGLPPSFITYMLNRLGLFPDPALVDIVVGAVFAVIVVLTAALLWQDKKQENVKTP